MRKIFFYISLFIFSWIYSIHFSNIDWDLWARLAVGKVFFQAGHILKHDFLSYTLTKPWIDHEWGSGVIFYFLGDHFGDAGLLLLKIILTFTILVLVSKVIEIQDCKNKTQLNILFLLLILLGTFQGTGGTVRCQAFTFLLFALWVYVLERVRRGENRLLWIFPVTMLIWANLHGGFVSGLGLLFIYGIGEFLNKKPFKKYFLILIPTAISTLINPYGIDYWVYIIQAITMPRPEITEWWPMKLFDSPFRHQGFKIILVITLISLIFSIIKSKPKMKELGKKFNELDKVKYLLLFITLYLALKHIKHQSFFVIIAGSFMYQNFYSIFSTIRDFIIAKFGIIADKVLKNTALIKDYLVFGFILIAGCLLIYGNPVVIRVPMKGYPVGSVEFIRQNKLKGNVFTLFHWGSYAAWKLYPNCFIYIDGRYEEVYSDEIFNLHRDFLTTTSTEKQPWYSLIKKYHTDIMILPNDLPGYYGVKLTKNWKGIDSDGWREVYNDGVSGVFVHIQDAKKTYIIPKLTEASVNKEKYITDINFN